MHIQPVGINMKMRYISFCLGAFLGFLCGAMSMQVMASDENGEVVCLAKNIYFEAGNQPLAGKVAVAHVVFNRMEHSAYPKDICGVVYQTKWRENWKGKQVPVRNQCQFSWFCDGKSDKPKNTKVYNEISELVNYIYDVKGQPNHEEAAAARCECRRCPARPPAGDEWAHAGVA